MVFDRTFLETLTFFKSSAVYKIVTGVLPCALHTKYDRESTWLLRSPPPPICHAPNSVSVH